MAAARRQCCPPRPRCRGGSFEPPAAPSPSGSLGTHGQGHTDLRHWGPRGRTPPGLCYITIKAEDPDCLSSSSYRDAEGERFLSSSSSTARRVSFNEAALFDQGKKTQEKGRRYTLTEGDFHHLKNARLTHLHLPPPALKIVTIHECESSENSLAMTPRLPPAKPGLAIFQPPAGALPQDCWLAAAQGGRAPTLG
nr:PREDICTED: protein Dos [Apteryx mantelli mantelli]